MLGFARLLAIAISVHKGFNFFSRNLICFDFTDGIKLTLTGWSELQQIASPATSNGKNVCYKMFTVRKSSDSPGIPDFSGSFFNL